MAEPREHCWHETGVMLLSHPPMTPVKCCWCGITAARRMRCLPVAGHGLHVLVERQEAYIDTAAPCIPGPDRPAA